MDGHPLNAMITIRPRGELTPLEHAELVAKFWNRLGVWSRRITQSNGRRRPSFHCVLVREAEPNPDRTRPGLGEHFHALLHVPAGCFGLLKETVARWHPGDDVHVQPAHQRVDQTPSGKIKSAIGYLTKQRTPQAWWGTNYRRKAGGIVVGKRFRITANLRANASVVVALPKRQLAG